jgi:hypothetical protein
VLVNIDDHTYDALICLLRKIRARGMDAAERTVLVNSYSRPIALEEGTVASQILGNIRDQNGDGSKLPPAVGGLRRCR